MLTCATCGSGEPEGSRFCGSCGTQFEPADVTQAVAANAPGLTCASCGNAEPTGSLFCGNCGTPFVPADPQPDDTTTVGEATLVCPTCGSEEPAGSRFCGSCGSPMTAAGPALSPAAPAPQPTVEHPSPIEPPPSGAPPGRKRVPWIAAGGVAALLVAGGVVAALLLQSDGDGDSTELVSTAQPPPQQPTTTEPVRLPAPTLAESITPSFQAIAAAQDALDDRLRSLVAGVESFAALRTGTATLVTSLVQTKLIAEDLTPGDAAEAKSLPLLRRAVAVHLAYADALLSFPPLPRSLTEAQARAAIARAEEAQRAYAKLAFADPSLPSIFVSTAGTPRLLAVVPAARPKPAPSFPVRRQIDLAPLLVGIRPDDDPGEGRCFGPYTSRATLRVAGVVHGSGFIQCGDDANGDPSRTSGIYRFSGPAFPAGARLARFTAQVAIDESSSSSQRGTQVTWTVIYDGAPVCTATVVWRGSRPSPTSVDCRVLRPASVGEFDLGRLRIQQVAIPASSGSLWAGLLNPKVVVEVPGR